MCSCYPRTHRFPHFPVFGWARLWSGRAGSGGDVRSHRKLCACLLVVAAMRAAGVWGGGEGAFCGRAHRMPAHHALTSAPHPSRAKSFENRHRHTHTRTHVHTFRVESNLEHAHTLGARSQEDKRAPTLTRHDWQPATTAIAAHRQSLLKHGGFYAAPLDAAQFSSVY